MDPMDSGYLLMSSYTIVSMMNENGFPPVIGTFLFCYCTILLVALLNLNFLKFPNLLGL
jgi:hypothetical protein